MIRFKLKELVSEREFLLGKRITLKEIAEKTGINRMTLTKINTQHGYSTSTDTLDKLCEYFKCDVSDLVEYISNEAYDQMKGHKH
jgi:putative transcriptional regulator